jgi:hypothetical protein
MEEDDFEKFFGDIKKQEIKKKKIEQPYKNKNKNKNSFLQNGIPNLNFKRLYDTDLKNSFGSNYFSINDIIEYFNQSKNKEEIKYFEKYKLNWIPQGTAEYFEFRKQFEFTGSMLACVLGLQMKDTSKLFSDKKSFGEESHYNHYISLFKKIPSGQMSIDNQDEDEDEKEQFDLQGKVNMKQGNFHEANGKFISFQWFLDNINKNVKMAETGIWRVELERLIHIKKIMEIGKSIKGDFNLKNDYDLLPIIGVSPDALIFSKMNNLFPKHNLVCEKCRKLPVKDGLKCNHDCFYNTDIDHNNADEMAIFEIKSRSMHFIDSSAELMDNNQLFKFFPIPPFKEPPWYYIPQIQFEMFVTGFKVCYLVSFSVISGTNIFRIEYNEDYCLTIIKLLCKIKLFCLKVYEPFSIMKKEHRDILQKFSTHIQDEKRDVQEKMKKKLIQKQKKERTDQKRKLIDQFMRKMKTTDNYKKMIQQTKNIIEISKKSMVSIDKKHKYYDMMNKITNNKNTIKTALIKYSKEDYQNFLDLLK